MKFTLSWLLEHLETKANIETIESTLTNIGLEVESIKDRTDELKYFKVAKVLSAEKHPNADRLKVCKVKSQNGIFQVVCGAPNAKTGMLGVFAPENTYIPGTNLKLKKSNIRGVESCGMLVSEKEMGISDEHEGIIEINSKYNITDLNLNFPDVSCNCVLLVKQDGTGSRTITNYKTFDQAGGNESTVKFAGGSNPALTTTANKLDIFSFYWDNDNHTAYGVVSQNF